MVGFVFLVSLPVIVLLLYICLADVIVARLRDISLSDVVLVMVVLVVVMVRS